MTETPNIWNVGDEIPFELFVMDPVTNLGLAGQTTFIAFSVKRLSDNNYWSGSAWVGTLSPLSVSESDPTNEKGRYTFVLDSAANNQPDVYLFHAKINNPAVPISGENYEQHKSRVTDVRVYEAEPSL